MGEEGQEQVLDEKDFSRKMSEVEYDEGANGPFSLFKMLRHKLRILADGLIVGSRAFIETRYCNAPPDSYEVSRKHRKVRQAPCDSFCYACRRANRIA